MKYCFAYKSQRNASGGQSPPGAPDLLGELTVGWYSTRPQLNSLGFRLELG